MLFDIAGKVVVITGGSGVLGSTMGRELAKQGAKIVILDLNEDGAKAVAQEITDAGGTAIGLAGNVLEKEHLETAAKQVIDTYGRVDALINCAGGNHPDATVIPGEKTFFDLTKDGFQKVFNLNFLGSVLPSQVFGEIMGEQQEGVILNISSMAATRPMTRVVAYAGAKAGISNFTHWLAVYMATEVNPNIRVNALAPGFFLTEQNRFLLTDEQTGGLTQRGQQVIDHTPMGRFGDPEDLVGTVIWLLSDAAKFVTGIVVPIDGGFSAYSGV